MECLGTFRFAWSGVLTSLVLAGKHDLKGQVIVHEPAHKQPASHTYPCDETRR